MDFLCLPMSLTWSTKKPHCSSLWHHQKLKGAFWLPLILNCCIYSYAFDGEKGEKPCLEKFAIINLWTRCWDTVQPIQFVSVWYILHSHPGDPQASEAITNLYDVDVDVWKVQPSNASSCRSWGLIDEVIRESRSPQSCSCYTFTLCVGSYTCPA